MKKIKHNILIGFLLIICFSPILSYAKAFEFDPGGSGTIKIRNGNFESGTLAYWTTGGDHSAEITGNPISFFGDYSCRMGFGPNWWTTEFAWIKQTGLNFGYNNIGADGLHFKVYTDGITTNPYDGDTVIFQLIIYYDDGSDMDYTIEKDNEPYSVMLFKFSKGCFSSTKYVAGIKLIALDGSHTMIIDNISID